ncbi:unnamed protein product [Trichobilharzia regenti]|nr:unnamed protein product [Trichobilharzia regenti]
MKLSGLSIQVALPVRTSERQSFARQQGLPLAPVEVCECPNPSGPDERELSPSCEVSRPVWLNSFETKHCLILTLGIDRLSSK